MNDDFVLKNIIFYNQNCLFFLQGGPGATSLYGLFKENGPIKAYTVSDNQFGHSQSSQKIKNKKSPKPANYFDDRYLKTPQPFPLYDRYAPKSELNRYSWNRNASLLYIDNPVGTGFSFTDHKSGYPNFVNQSSDDLFRALQQFFQMFDEYKERYVYNYNNNKT